MRISEHERAIVQLKRDINSQIPVNQLLPEILSEILLAWVSQWRKINKGCRRKYAHGWISIAQVCHVWRENALSFPRLWSNFQVTGANSLEVLLCRSVQAPLHITIDFEDILGPEELIPRILAHLPRIRVIDVEMGEKSYPLFAAGETAATLRSLIYQEYTLSSQHGTPHIGTPFDAIDMPSLTSLKLQKSRAPGPWTSPLLKPTLARLSLSARIYDGHQVDWTAQWDTVLRALRSMPLLEDLDLSRVLPDTAPNFVLPTALLLPRLRALTLMDSTSSIACLLRILVYPTSSHIRLRIISTDSNTEAVKCLSSVLAAKAAAGEASCSTGSPRLPAVYCSDQEVLAWTRDPGIGLLDAPLQWDPLPHLLPDFRLVSYGSADVYDMLLPHLASFLPAEHITTLYFEPRAVSWSAEAQCTLSAQWEHMSNVRTLGVGELGCTSMLQVLDGSHRRTTDGGAGGAEALPTQVLFPRLEALMLHGVRIHDNPPTEVTKHRILETLHRTLSERKATGHQLKKLVLVKCLNLGAVDVASLGGLAEEVEWDRQENWVEKIPGWGYPTRID